MGQVIRLIGALAIGVSALTCGDAGAWAQGAQDPVSALAWPRDFDHGGQRIEIYQPQIERWAGDQISGRAAIAIAAQNGSPTYGVAEFSADADIDKTAGLARLRGITIGKVDVPTDPAAAAGLQAALQDRLPSGGM